MKKNKYLSFAVFSLVLLLLSCGEKKSEVVKVGLLHSLSGTMSISETSVRDAELLAISEINEAGGVLGRQIEAVVSDGASEAQIFADEARRLIQDENVASIFGCWTSASRKAVKTVVEDLYNLLWYPLQYEGMEASPNIMLIIVPKKSVKKCSLLEAIMCFREQRIKS